MVPPPPPPPNPLQPIQTLHISTEQRAARCWMKWHRSRHISLSSASHCAVVRWWTCGSLTSWHICVPSILTPGHAANPVLHHCFGTNLLYLLNSFSLYAGGERTSLHFWDKTSSYRWTSDKNLYFGMQIHCSHSAVQMYWMAMDQPSNLNYLWKSVRKTI